MQNMKKTFVTFFLCVCLSLSLIACGKTPSQDTQEKDSEMQSAVDSSEEILNSTENTSEDDSQEALLGPDATDEELLGVLGDDVHIVTDDAFEETVAAFSEHIEEYAGQLYQLEGIYTVDGENPYITKAVGDGGNGSESRLLLKYMTKDPEEGARIRVTGVINPDDTNGDPVTALEVVVIELLDEQ